ncbi:MAG: cupin domain-containing protein [Phycisphaerales bacterium JB043]
MTESTYQYAHVITWDDLPGDQPMEKITRKRIIGVNMMLSHVFLEKDFAVEEHAHANEQFAIVVSGKVAFGINGKGTDRFQKVTLSAGQVLVIPPNCPHSAHALEDTLIIDCFSPPSDTTGVDHG